MFDALARRIAHHPRRTVLVWTLIAAAGFGLAVGGVGGESIFERLTTGAPDVPGSESADRQPAAATSTIQGAPASASLSTGVDPPAPTSPSRSARRSDLMAVPGVASVIDPYLVPGGPQSPAAAPLVAADGDGFLVVVDLDRELAAEAETVARREVERPPRGARADV